jgi:deoxyribodipyrimidine photo-lyase
VTRPLSIVWFRRDLRLDDNPALREASLRGAVVPVYVWSPDAFGDWPPGAASRWWLHHSLSKLNERLAAAGSRLILLSGPPEDLLVETAKSTGADTVLWNGLHEKTSREEEDRVSGALRDAGVRAESFGGAALFDPDAVRTSQGGPFKVFTPFWKACLALPAPFGPLPPPKTLSPPPAWPGSVALDDLGLLPAADRAGGLRESWRPGETGAGEALEKFLAGTVRSYTASRNRPDIDGTSRLSPHLHFGEISPRRVWHETGARSRSRRPEQTAAPADDFLRQIGWREFAHHLIRHFPHTSGAPLRPEFLDFPWRKDTAGLEAWRKGATGYPIVDAGMRELWTTGWMHNRVRMVAASFLVKDLLVHWLEGARWFWETLVDADLANNTLGWQWTAGCGADAAPFYRIFNPVIQGEKFDPDGKYVGRWVPELAGLPSRWIHKPWEAPALVLGKAGVRLGKDYPERIVDHYAARDRALEALARIKEKR